MAMSFIYGDPGAGKTHGMVKYELLPAIKSGRSVFTNINGLGEESCLRQISKMTGKTFDEVISLITFFPCEGMVFIGNPSLGRSISIGKDLMRLVRLGNEDTGAMGDLIILDESSDPELFDASNKLTPEMWIFFKKHRHYQVDIILMGHHPTDVIRKVQRLSGRFTYYRKLDGVSKNMFSYEIWLNGYSAASRGRMVKTAREKYDSDIFKCYKSTMIGEGGKDGVMDDRFSLLKSNGLKMLVLALVAFFVLVPITYSYLFGDNSMLVSNSKFDAVVSPVSDSYSELTPSMVKASLNPYTQVDKRPKMTQQDFFVNSLFSDYKPFFDGFVVVGNKSEGFLSFNKNGFSVFNFTFSELSRLGFTFSFFGGNRDVLDVVYKSRHFFVFHHQYLDDSSSNVGMLPNAANLSGG